MSAGGFAVAPGAGGSEGLKPLLPTSTIEVAVKCTGLSDQDLFSKSDPFCVLFQKKSGHWYEIGRTEKIEVNLIPPFASLRHVVRAFNLFSMTC